MVTMTRKSGHGSRIRDPTKIVILFAIIFILNFLFMSLYFPTDNHPALARHPEPPIPQKRIHNNATTKTTSNRGVKEDVCPYYGCPIYPAELTPYLHEIMADMYVHKNRTESFDFGTETMALLTQRGASHYDNQDKSVVIQPFLAKKFGASQNTFLACVFDGHGVQGHIVANHVVKDLPERLADKLDALEEEELTDAAIVKILNETFVEVDIHAPPNFLLGGCTATVTLRIGSKLYFANAGDSQTILVTVDPNNPQPNEPTVVYMTRKDKAYLPDEYERITNLGGKIFYNPENNNSRVIVYSVASRDQIALAMSRSIGDWEWKAVGVTAEPLVDIIDLSQHPQSFLIAASDGVWDVRRRQFYARQFAESFYVGNTIPLQKVWEVIKKITPKAETGYRDDITAIVMKLDD